MTENAGEDLKRWGGLGTLGKAWNAGEGVER